MQMLTWCVLKQRDTANLDDHVEIVLVDDRREVLDDGDRNLEQVGVLRVVDHRLRALGQQKRHEQRGSGER